MASGFCVVVWGFLLLFGWVFLGQRGGYMKFWLWGLFVYPDFEV